VFVRVQEATSRADREEIYRFRYRVYVEELKKPLPFADHERRIYTDELDDQARILVAYDENAGTIVGTVRTMFGAETAFPPSLVDKLSLGPLLEEPGPDRICHSGMFMVDPAYRGLTIASQLVATMYRIAYEVGALLEICISELALVRPYYQMGYRPFAPPFRPYESAGLRVPLAWTLRDRDYLQSVGSPFAGFLAPEMSDSGAMAAILDRRYEDFRSPKVTPRKLGEFWSAVAHSSPAFRPPSIFEGVDRERIDPYLENLPTLQVPAGQRFYTRGENEKGMGLLLSGKLGVTLDDGPDPFLFAVLTPGELFGEMANFLSSGRSASLLALEDSEVLLLPDGLVEKLERKDPEVGQAVRRNVTALLASRLDAMNHRVVGLSRGNPERVRPSPVPPPAPPVARAKMESYSIATLEDSEAELDRLEQQAAVGQEIESVWFRRIGFEDSRTFLDIGSGPGLTSFLLARLFPRARVLGVEPEVRLRARAVERSEEMGLQERVTFMDGTGEALPLEADSVDFVYCRFLLQHVSRPVGLLEEACRVVRPGGIIGVMDVDDGGIVVHPEPMGFQEFQRRVYESQATLGGDRRVGRKLAALLEEAGFEGARTDVLNISSHVFPIQQLADLAFSFKAQTLRRAGLWDEADEELLDALQNLAGRPDAWLYVPVFLAHARKP